MRRLLVAAIAAAVVWTGSAASAEDWPEFRGKGRRGVWTETGILRTFPPGGLEVRWRTPIRGGYSSPSVSEGRIFLTDFTAGTGLEGTERALALDEATGRVLWTQEWPTDYAGLMWAHGPRATPTVDGDRVYVVGARGRLVCLDAQSGEIRWSVQAVEDYGAPVSMWGAASAPIVDGDVLVAVINGPPDALLVGFDKHTGRERWRALRGLAEPGLNQPLVITAGGARQLIYWGPDAINSLDPATGKVFWRHPWQVGDAMNLALPVHHDPYLLLSHFGRGSMLLELHRDRPGVTEIWRGTSSSEILTDGLHSMYGTPIVQDGFIYGLCSYGQLRCLRLDNAERVWETQAVTVERARWASGNIVRHQDRVFFANDRGELVMARLTPEGYEELDRTQLITPTTPPGVRRRLGAVQVSHPAFANRHIYVRNDEEVIAYSMEATDAASPPPSPVSRAEPAAAPSAAVAAVEPSRRVHIQYMPGLPDVRRLADPNNTAYSTLYLLSGGGANTIAFATDEGVVLVSAKRAGWGEALLATLGQATNEPVRTIINTAPDPEYVGANGEYPTVTSIVAHETTRTAMAVQPAFSGDRARFLPGRTYTGELSLFEGRSRMLLRAFGAAHTAGDTVVHIPAFRLAYLGELYPGRMLPRIDRAHGGSALAFADTLDKVIATLEGVEIVVPGREAPANRGNLLTGMPPLAALEAYGGFVRAVVDHARKAHAAGTNAAEAARTLALPERFASYDTSGAQTFIETVYDELGR
ncbi:MAG: hypothetical protein FJW23_03675 [Acidimicrobiia bacterium]|nr:hypothetical protein [Acidimicrobiia bacterium]